MQSHKAIIIYSLFPVTTLHPFLDSSAKFKLFYHVNVLGGKERPSGNINELAVHINKAEG